MMYDDSPVVDSILTYPSDLVCPTVWGLPDTVCLELIIYIITTISIYICVVICTAFWTLKIEKCHVYLVCIVYALTFFVYCLTFWYFLWWWEEDEFDFIGDIFLAINEFIAVCCIVNCVKLAIEYPKEALVICVMIFYIYVVGYFFMYNALPYWVSEERLELLAYYTIVACAFWDTAWQTRKLADFFFDVRTVTCLLMILYITCDSWLWIWW